MLLLGALMDRASPAYARMVSTGMHGVRMHGNYVVFKLLSRPIIIIIIMSRQLDALNFCIKCREVGIRPGEFSGPLSNSRNISNNYIL